MSDDLITLTDAEREHFARYCAQEASTDKAMADQMDKSNAPPMMSQRLKIRSAAYSLVAKDLQSWETMTI